MQNSRLLVGISKFSRMSTMYSDRQIAFECMRKSSPIYFAHLINIWLALLMFPMLVYGTHQATKATTAPEQ